MKGDPRWDIWVLPGDVVSVPPQEYVRVSVLGAVERPGIYQLLEEEASLLQAIASAQGLSVRGSKKGIELRRVDDAGNETILQIHLSDILSGESPDERLLEGDVVYVNEKFF